MDLNLAWTRALEILSAEISRPSYDAWLKSAQPLAVHDDLVLLAVPNQFARTYLQGKLAARVAAALSTVLQRKVTIDFVVPPGASEGQEEPAAAADPRPAPRTRARDGSYQPLNPRYIFDTFVVGPGNRLAHAAALAVAEAPAKAYNPLFIYGGVGLGKTHLMHAIAHHILAKDAHARVAYVSSETFTNELIHAIRDGRQLQFRNRYRNVDVLLIDDVQFIAGKETTQEEFFHTFNALHEARRQIVISSDRPPKEIPTLEDRLRSRFEWGLISDIQPPDFETRVAILQKKAQVEGVTVPAEVLEFLATKIASNIRELEGAFIRLIAYASFHRREFSVDLAEEALQEIFPPQSRPPLTISGIQEAVAAHYHLDVRDLKVRKRTRAVAFPRQVAMFLARELTENSLPQIGQAFGGRDHTTVMYACEKIAQEIQNDPNLAATIAALKKKLLG